MTRNGGMNLNTVILWGLVVALQSGCGQSDLELPNADDPGGMCGDWYPGAGNDAGEVYGFTEEQTLPCVVFTSARLGEEDTYINWSNMFLDAQYGHSDKRSIALVIGAENCPSCALFIRELADNAARVDAAGAFMINVTFCDNIDRTDCDFDLAHAVLTATSEGWPVDEWYVTNDEDDYVSVLYRDSFPTVITARMSDMRVVDVDRAPRFEKFIDLLESL